MAEVPAALWWLLGGVGALLALVLIASYVKGRPFSKAGAVFRASRFSRGNHLLPTQVLITRTSVVHYTPEWIGRREQTIHLAHVASVKIDTGALLSDLLIETSGGTSAVACHGHRKSDAVAMKDLIERYQTDYYRARREPDDSSVGPLPSGR